MKKTAIFWNICAVIFFLVVIANAQLVTVFADNEAGENNSGIQSLKEKVGGDLKYSVDRNTGKVTFIRSEKGVIPLEIQKNAERFNLADSASIADQFIEEYGTYFGAADPKKDLFFSKKDTDSLGMTHVRYGQKYNGIPVFGGQIIVHLEKDKRIKSANGKIIPDIFLDTSPGILEDQAAEKAKELWKEQKRPESPEVLKNKLYIFNKALFQNKPTDTKNYLVWRVELYKDRPASHEYFFIDAKNGDLVFQITGMQDVVHRHIWDCSFMDGDCYLDATSPFPPFYTYGRSEDQPARGPQPILDLSDTDNLYDRVGNNYDYYSEKFSRDGANNEGGMGDGTPTYPTDTTVGLTFIDYYLLEGFQCPNSWFNGVNSIHFCQDETTHDIVGHEYAHAVNYFSILDGGEPSGLIYSGESGALNENNSDVFGEALEYYSTSSNDWLFGESAPGGPFRDMSMPSNYTYNVGGGDTPYPNKFYDSNYYCGEEDNSGVHINSSVPNHAAYLMAIGGTYNGCTISGIGREKEEAIFYRAQTVYYIPSTDFNGGYDALISSCNDSYGSGSDDCINVIKALRSVEMDQGGQCSEIPQVAPACSAPTITSVSSDKANGFYDTGDVIDIDVTFSRAVTSVGDVTVTLETGDTDRSCTFAIDNSTTGTCDYTVQDGDISNDLNVSSISGTIADPDGWAITNFTPAANLAVNKNIKINSANTSYVGLFRPNTKTFYLKDTNSASGTYTKFVYGASTDIPLSGDWDGDGYDTIGLFRPSTHTFYLKSANTAGASAIKFAFGSSTDLPIVGDWNGDGIDTVGIFRPSTANFYLKSANTAGASYTKFKFGSSTDKPIVGDWNGDGIDTIGLFRPSTANFYLKSANTAGASYTKFKFGSPTDKPITGAWKK